MAVNTRTGQAGGKHPLDKRVVIITADNAVQEDQEANQVGHIIKI